MNAITNPTTITAAPQLPYLEVVREFDAAPALVFRAVTEPDLVVQWLGPRSRRMRVETWDARSGGTYRYFHVNDENEVGFRGVFHTVTPDELIIQTFEFDGAPNQVTLDYYVFEDLGGRTRLRLSSVFPSVATRDMALSTGMTGGITESMDRLQELLATQS